MKAYPHIDAINEIFIREFPIVKSAVEKAHTEFGEEWAMRFNTLLAKLFADTGSKRKAAHGYVDFVVDFLRLQVKFDKTGEYIAKSYADAAREVYHNAEYMNNLYLPGILLSHYLWPHHYRQNEFFRNMFLPAMRNANARYFVDVGIGTGYYSRMILEEIPLSSGHGYDISENAGDYTLKQISAFGLKDRYKFEIRDVIANPAVESTDWLVSVEVLEHLEDPISFLKGLRRMLRPGGRAFITAALNAPNADHIFLYRSPGDVLNQLREAGFKLEQYHSSFAHSPRRLGQAVPEISAFIVT